MGSESKPTSPDFLEVAVKLAGLIVLALPLVGVGIRGLAFWLAGFEDPIALAGRYSVPSLASTAFNAVGIQVGLYAALIFAVYRGWIISRGTTPTAPTGGHAARWRRLEKWLANVVIVLWAVLVLFFASFPTGLLLAVVSGLAGLQLGVWLFRNQLTFYRAAAVVLIVGLFSVLIAGIEGSEVGNQVNTYTFTSASGLTDGKYALLGEADGFVYLDSCQGRGVVGVNQASILEFRSVTPTRKQTSLYGVIFRGGTLGFGYRRQC